MQSGLSFFNLLKRGTLYGVQQKYFILSLLLIGALAAYSLSHIVNKTTLPSPSNSSQSSNAQQTSLANPASVNCGKLGGTTVIKKDGTGGEYGLCEFEDNMACEEWALMRGECPVGGVKTTGYDNIQQMYCAWIGGETLAVTNAQCTLPDGKTCSADAVYNQTCK